MNIKPEDRVEVGTPVNRFTMEDFRKTVDDLYGDGSTVVIQTSILSLPAGRKFLYRGVEYTKTGGYSARDSNGGWYQFHREAEVDHFGSNNRSNPVLIRE